MPKPKRRRLATLERELGGRRAELRYYRKLSPDRSDIHELIEESIALLEQTIAARKGTAHAEA